jgi:hypothetical protein
MVIAVVGLTSRLDEVSRATTGQSQRRDHSLAAV